MTAEHSSDSMRNEQEIIRYMEKLGLIGKLQKCIVCFLEKIGR
jgi:hypothetical protein